MLSKLRASFPQYSSNITFMNVDWDKHGRAPVTTDRKIPRRSTLVMIKKGKEIGRLVAVTNEAEIKALLDKAID